ncbi:MAG TPA: hypothetical protein VGJ26_09280, partial [Pirellulales bacterium]
MSTSRGQDDVYNSAPVALDEPSRGDLVPVGAYGMQPTSGTAWQAIPHPRPEMLSAAPDPMSLLRAYQRRWLLASSLGALLAIGVMVMAAFLIPQTGDVVQYIRVSRNPEVVFGTARGDGKDEFETLKATTKQFMRSRMLLQAALRGDVAQLAIVQQQKDPINWLENNLALVFPDEAEILQVKMRGSEAQVDDLVIVVGAVVDAYFSEVVDADLKRREDKLLKLEKEFTDHNDKLMRET